MTFDPRSVLPASQLMRLPRQNMKKCVTNFRFRAAKGTGAQSDPFDVRRGKCTVGARLTGIRPIESIGVMSCEVSCHLPISFFSLALSLLQMPSNCNRTGRGGEMIGVVGGAD